MFHVFSLNLPVYNFFMSHPAYALGIDIGTSSVKCVAFSDQGILVHRESAGYKMQHDEAGRSEQDPEEILARCITVVENMLRHLHPVQPDFISFSAAMHSLIACDANGLARTSCILWADNRAASIADALRETATGMDYYHRSGVPIHAMSPFCKLIWFGQHDPVLLRSAFVWTGIKEYIFFHLLSVWKTDISIAAATGLLSLDSGQWDPVLLAKAGVLEKQLCKLVPVEEQTIYSGNAVRKISGLTAGIPFIIGASDGALSNIGAAPVQKASLVLTVGTSSAARVISDKKQTDPQMRSFCYRIGKDRFLIGGASNNGGIVLQWLKDRFLQTGSDFPALFAEAKKSTATNDGLIFLPYILGERAPIWNASARGVIYGLSIEHDRADIIRAAMEAVVHGLFGISNTILENQPVDHLYATGGFIESPEWLQMLADMFGRVISVSPGAEHAALGAVRIGWEAFGESIPAADVKAEVFTPAANRHAYHQRQFALSEKIYGLLEPSFRVS